MSYLYYCIQIMYNHDNPKHLSVESYPIFLIYSSLFVGRHFSIAIIVECPNPKNKSTKRLNLSNFTVISGSVVN